MIENSASKTRKAATFSTVPLSPRSCSTGQKKPRHLEESLQEACVKWFRLQYPEFGPLLFAIPNGGRRGKREAGRLKAQGVTPGVPDLQLACPAWPKEAGTPSYGLFMELKIAPNKASPAQHAMLDKLQEQGYTVKIIYSFDAFRDAVRAHIGY